jgi:proteasome component ECM29
MMVAIERCLDQVDAKVLKELAPKLCNLVRKGIGVPTKAGTSRIICSLTTRCPNHLAPHSTSLLKALSGVVQDRSMASRKTKSAAVGEARAVYE